MNDAFQFSPVFCSILKFSKFSIHTAFTYSKLSMEAPEKSVKFVWS